MLINGNKLLINGLLECPAEYLVSIVIWIGTSVFLICKISFESRKD